jgi:hypothetical protein
MLDTDMYTKGASVSLSRSNASKRGDHQDLEESAREWLARQVAWERRLLVLSRRAEAALRHEKEDEAKETRVAA